MRATEDLRYEHDSIKEFLELLDAMIRRMELGEAVEPDDLMWTCEFCRDFIERCHQGKEEHLLISAIEEAGMPHDALSSLMADHEAIAEAARLIRGAVAGYSCGDAWSSQFIIAATRRYIGLLTDHISTENELFYSTADEYLNREARHKLISDLQEYGQERIGPGRQKDLLEILGYLKAYYRDAGRCN